MIEHNENVTVNGSLSATELDAKRYQREELLSAFDKWEKAVLRGREEDDEVVMQWYCDLLDLKNSAFNNIPVRIRYYLNDML